MQSAQGETFPMKVIDSENFDYNNNNNLAETCKNFDSNDFSKGDLLNDVHVSSLPCMCCPVLLTTSSYSVK